MSNKSKTARLVAHTKPNVEGIEDVSEFIVFAARVSNPHNQLNMNTKDRLLNFLLRNKHWSPFEMVNAVVEVEAPRDITRQMLRHRSFAFQEFSGRYSKMEMIKGVREYRVPDSNNRQKSHAVEDRPVDKSKWNEIQNLFKKSYYYHYYDAIEEHGVAKEQARAILPEGLTQSRLYMQGTLRSFIHYVELRTGEGTQEEHRQVAKAIGEEIEKIFPKIKDFILT